MALEIIKSEHAAGFRRGVVAPTTTKMRKRKPRIRAIAEKLGHIQKGVSIGKLGGMTIKSSVNSFRNKTKPLPTNVFRGKATTTRATNFFRH